MNENADSTKNELLQIAEDREHVISSSLSMYAEILRTEPTQQIELGTAERKKVYDGFEWPCDPGTIKMIISDVDGTIVDSSTGKDRIDDRLAGAFHAFERLGGNVGFATGRSWSMLKPVIDNLGLIGPKAMDKRLNTAEGNGDIFATKFNEYFLAATSHSMAAVDGGSRIVDMDGETIWGVPIDKTAVTKVVEQLNSHGLTSVFWSNDKMDFTRQDLDTGWDLKDLDLSSDVFFLGVRAIGLDRKVVKEIADSIMSNVEGINVSVAEAQYNPGFCDLHITDQNATKKNAAMKMMELTGVKRSETVAAGDGGNDESLFEACGVRYAVGNAVQSLKDNADIVGPSIITDDSVEKGEVDPLQKHGFVYLLETIGLERYRAEVIRIGRIGLILSAYGDDGIQHTFRLADPSNPVDLYFGKPSLTKH